MLYRFLKIWVRYSSKIFCRHIIINKPEYLKIKGPVLLAVNHPNSFLDAIILDILFEEPVWSLARGDVFKTTFYKKLLTKLKILPIYRTSEGAENINSNYETFDACKSIFKKNGIVLMFSEGICVNEWHLRKLKKGTARLAFSSWKDGIDLKILPVGINYSSFRRFGKNIFLNFGSLIGKEDFDIYVSDGQQYLSCNEKLQTELQKLVYEISPADKILQEKLLRVKSYTLKKYLLAVPAIVGFLVHAPLYISVRCFTISKTQNNDHYDSVLIALLSFLYPLYLISFVLLFFLIFDNWLSFSLVFILPFTAWSFVQITKQLD